LPHRIVGSIWVLLMLVVSISAFFVHELRIWGPWSSLQRCYEADEGPPQSSALSFVPS
jgi:hypothetical protein